MNASKLTVKFFLADPASLDMHAVSRTFHSWIQTRALPNHTTIDVADYAHVINGPGILLTTHEANISTDCADAQPGLLYVRKRPLPGDFASRLRSVFTSAVHIASRLEQDLPAMQFDAHRVVIGINDRLLAPDTEETFAEVEPEVTAFFTSITPSGTLRLERRTGRGRVFELEALFAGEATIAAWAASLPLA